jgi:hypothetical protein
LRSWASRKSTGACKGGGDGLADVDAARDDDAVDRRADHGVVEVGLGEPLAGALEGELGAGGLDPHLRELDGGAGVVEVLLALGALGGEALDAGEAALRVAELELGLLLRGPGGAAAGRGLIDLGAERGGVDAGEDLALLHGRVVVDEDLGQAPGDLGADLDGDAGVEATDGRDLADDRAAAEWGAAEALLGRQRSRAQDDHGGDDPGEQEGEAGP